MFIQKTMIVQANTVLSLHMKSVVQIHKSKELQTKKKKNREWNNYSFRCKMMGRTEAQISFRLFKHHSQTKAMRSLNEWYTFNMPGNSTPRTVDNIKYSSWERKSLCAHHSRYSGDSPFKSKLDLRFMFIFWGKWHGEHISIK